MGPYPTWVSVYGGQLFSLFPFPPQYQFSTLKCPCINQGLSNSPTNDPGGNASNSGPSVISSQTENVQTSTRRYPSREREKPKYLGHVDDNNVDETANLSFTVHYCYCM